jgi:hypothetical protein
MLVTPFCHDSVTDKVEKGLRIRGGKQAQNPTFYLSQPTQSTRLDQPRPHPLNGTRQKPMARLDYFDLRYAIIATQGLVARRHAELALKRLSGTPDEIRTLVLSELEQSPFGDDEVERDTAFPRDLPAGGRTTPLGALWNRVRAFCRVRVSS